MTRPCMAVINSVNAARLVSYGGLIVVGVAFGPAWTIGLSFAGIAYIELVVRVSSSLDRWFERASDRRAKQVVDTIALEIVDEEPHGNPTPTPAGKRLRISGNGEE